MKKLLFALFALFICLSGYADDVPRGWTDDINAAMKEAEAKKRPILILFTGSDWCSWCKRLKADVLDGTSFKNATENSVVLVYFDFPVNKKVDPEKMAERKRWVRKFGVSGYPTAIITDADGNLIGKISGYDTEANYIRQLNALIGQKNKRYGW
jgi:protein disulfide-isomerase